jgi:hypothetical protein
MLSANAMERRLQFAGILLMLGLLVEALCLTFGHGAVGFLIFTGVGGFSLLLGISYYLLALVRSGTGGH